MTVSYIASNTQRDNASGTSLDAASLNVLDGDMVLVVGRFWNSATVSPTFTFSSAQGNIPVVGGVVVTDTNLHTAGGWHVCTADDAALVINMALDVARQFRDVLVAQFRSDVGLVFQEIVLDNGAENGALTTDAYTLGADGFAAGMIMYKGNATYSSPQTNWIEPTVAGTASPNNADLKYRIGAVIAGETMNHSGANARAARVFLVQESAGGGGVTAPTTSNVSATATNDSVTVTADISSTETPTASALLDGTVDQGPSSVTIAGSAPNFTASYTFTSVPNDTYTPSVQATNSGGTSSAVTGSNVTVNYTAPHQGDVTLGIRVTKGGEVVNDTMIIQVTQS